MIRKRLLLPATLLICLTVTGIGITARLIAVSISSLVAAAFTGVAWAAHRRVDVIQAAERLAYPLNLPLNRLPRWHWLYPRTRQVANDAYVARRRVVEQSEQLALRRRPISEVRNWVYLPSETRAAALEVYALTRLRAERGELEAAN
jgi:hypothetical protein